MLMLKPGGSLILSNATAGGTVSPAHAADTSKFRVRRKKPTRAVCVICSPYIGHGSDGSDSRGSRHAPHRRKATLQESTDRYPNVRPSSSNRPQSLNPEARL